MVIQFQKLDFPGLLKIGNSVSCPELSEKTFGGGTPKTSNESFGKEIYHGFNHLI